MLRILTFIILLLAFHVKGKAQVKIIGDTLAPAEVKGMRIGGGGIKDAYTPGIKTVGMDSLTKLAYRNESLAALLAGATTIFVKSYGFNSFATLSFRGASAAQSAVYWEGVPLMNGATGLTDVSLLPVSLIDSVSLDYGGSAALYGSGNVGGAVMLRERRPVFSKKLTAQGQLGVYVASFNQVGWSGTAKATMKRFCFAVGAERMFADGNFPVTDEQGKAFITQHAHQKRETVKASTSWLINNRNILSAHYWSQLYERQIPRALFEALSQKEQHDRDERILLHWERSAQTSHSYAKAAFLDNSFDYTDSAIGLQSGFRTRQLFSEVGWAGKIFKGGHLLLFAPAQLFFLDSATKSRRQTRVAVAGAFTHRALRQRAELAVNFRMESFDGKLIALPGANASYTIAPELRIRANAQHTYRAPTLNELYYNPGGNVDLKPEQGWSFDGGYDFQKALCSGQSLSHSLSAYNRHIRDWIIWLGGAIWTPHNLAAVHSQGIQTENSLAGKWKDGGWRIGLNAAYTRSITSESYLTGDNSIGRQIPYVPLLAATAVAGGSWKGFYLEWSTSYTGMRYITSDESAALPAYCVGNLRLRFTKTIRKLLPVTAQFSINNIWNVRYEVVGFRPMPGINGSLGLSFLLEETD